MRDAAIFELLENQLERRHLLFVRLAHHDGGIAGGERMGGIGLKLDPARAVEEGKAVAKKSDGGHVELDAHAVMAGLLRGVAERIAAPRGSLPSDGTGPRQDSFE